MKEIVAQQDLETAYKELKQASYTFFEKDDYENSLKMIEGCAKLAYEFNFISSFCDDELEALLIRIFDKVRGKATEFVPNKKQVLFYDYFAIDNRGLTQQYLTALMKADFEILFVIPNDIHYNAGNDIIRQLKDYRKCRCVIYSNTLTLSERIKRLCNLIEEYKPAFTFLHLSPWDVIACATFPNYPSTKKFFINLTDHAFWLGKSSIDICINFRNYGYQLNKVLRGIDTDKQVILPFYPILQSEESFLGLPDITKGKVIGLSGGSGYKFIGDNWRFYTLIKEVLLQNENFVFLLVGCNGSVKAAFEKRISDDKLENRFVLVDDRYDIFQLIKHIDIYFGSYPFPGGLMMQLACLAAKPVITLVSKEKIFSYAEDLIAFRDIKFKSYSDNQDFINVASKAIQDRNFRIELASYTSEGVISVDEFTSGLMNVINGQNPYPLELHTIDGLETLSVSMSEWYLEIENTVSKKFFNLLNPYFNVVEQVNKETFFYQKFSKNRKVALKRKVSDYVRYLCRCFYSKVKHKLIKKGIYRRKEKTFCQLNFKSLGSNCYVSERFTVLNPKYMSIGDNFGSLYNLRIEAWDTYSGERFHPELIFGNNVNINIDCHIGCINKIVLGDNVLIGSRVYISDHSHGNITKNDLRLPPVERPLFSKGSVIIEDNVWIGEGVCILPGVRIGRNSIIGANAVVTKNIPQNSVAGGVPAKVLKEIGNEDLDSKVEL